MRFIFILVVLLAWTHAHAVNDIPEKGQDTLFKPVPDSSQVQQMHTPTDEVLVENSAQVELIRMKVDNEFKYIAMLCGLSLASLTIVLFFLRGRDHTAKDIVNISGLNLIIFATIILVLVVNTSEQLTAAIGILGAIAGYLFRSVQDQKEAGEK